MAMIPRTALDYVTEQINGLSADAQAKVLKVLQALDWKPDDADNIAACRQAVVDALASIMPTYTDAAAQASADFYDATRQLVVGEPLGAQAISGYDPRKTEGAVRSFVRFVLEDRVETFNDQVLQRIDYETKRAAGTSMIENGKRDPLKPRYARVPTGSETCAFCIMLASRGFVYHTEGTAGAVDHYHANCDCRIVCGWDTYASGASRRRASGVEVEGYDMDALYDQYVDDLRSGRLKLGDVAKNTSHVQNWKSEDFKSYKDFADFIEGAKDMEDLQYRCAVVESEWANSGLSSKYYEMMRLKVAKKKTGIRKNDPGISGGAIYEKPREALEDHEKAGVDHLVRNGITPVVRAEDPTAKANIDFEIDGDLYEMKNVKNDSSASNQIKRARIKWYKLGIESPMKCVFTTEDSTKSFDEICKSLEMRRHEGEVLIVLSKNGDMVTLE